MTKLKTASNLPDPDAAYRLIVEAHRGLTDEESAALDARLVLILANQVGDMEALREAVKLAREAGEHRSSRPERSDKSGPGSA